MNFKFTKSKTIVSILIGLIIGFYIFTQYRCVGNCPDNFYFIKIGYLILALLITFIVVYLIWSLFQKKK